MASDDHTVSQSEVETRPLMQAQVVLERLGFGAGIIDGKSGISTKNAISGFQEANGLPITGELDEQTATALARWSGIPATRTVTIPREWGRIAFQALPDDPAAQAELAEMGYESLDEKLAERFHTTVEVLRELNPRSSGNETGTPRSDASPAASEQAPYFSAGQKIRVPNVGADRIDPAQVDDPKWLDTLRSLGVGTDQLKLTRLVVDKSAGWLKGYDASDKLVVTFTVTTGSEHDPLPIGNWSIVGVGRNPDYAYDPALLRGVPASAGKHRLPPGPNSPVGVVWIDLSKEHYGIHGTNSPETVGRAQSNGCVRLTNWDAARLAQMVGSETKVVFQE